MASGSPLSMDLRVRAVEAYENGEGTYQKIADRFCIGRTTLCDLVRLSRYAGTLELNPIRGRKPHSVDEVGRERIRALVAEQPDAILAELTERYNQLATVKISRATMGRVLQSMKLSRKKDRLGARARHARHPSPAQAVLEVDAHRQRQPARLPQ